jgi:glycosyltransferase involved in cell wall biosynthesis
VSLRIGILGTRGIPNHYGGFEQCAQYLSVGLVSRGHLVTVYNSSLHPFQESNWHGVNIQVCRDREDSMGTAGQFIYDLNCIWHARSMQFDVIIQLGYTSSSIWHFLWPKTKHIVNMDGLEYKRDKYSSTVKSFLKWAEKVATKRADLLIADNPGIESYLRSKYKNPVRHISYGADIPTQFNVDHLSEFGLKPEAYDLTIARMEPENSIETIIQAYAKLERKLVLVGSTQTPFGRKLKETYSHVVFLEQLFDKEKLDALRYYSSKYIHGHTVGGTNPSLLEAMACNCAVIAHDNVFNRAVLKNAGQYFNDVQNLWSILKDEKAHGSTSAVDIIRQAHSWDDIVIQYEQACYAVVEG